MVPVVAALNNREPLHLRDEDIPIADSSRVAIYYSK